MNEFPTVHILYELAAKQGRGREMRIMESGKIIPSGWSAAARSCDWCESSAALVFCRVDSAYLCAACDEGVHGGRRGGKHERVWMCVVCEQAPAAVTCKADSAALCPSCDRDIHSANPLARRHDRLPVIPFYEPAVSLLRSSSGLLPADSVVMNPPDGDGAHNKTLEEAEAASWLLPHPGTGSNHKIADAAANNDLKSGELLFGSADPLLDFDYSVVSMDVRLADSVVPVQKRALAPELPNHRASESCFDLDFTKSKLAAFSDSPQSLSQSVSSDVGVVPESNSLSDASYSFGRQIRAGWDPASSAATQAMQLSGTEREARVMRYREKRKNRKFEKTIRYASRKAYAETRPRIKGRFAKRADMEAEVEVEVDACFYVPAGSVAFDLAVDPGYGVVPSF